MKISPETNLIFVLFFIFNRVKLLRACFPDVLQNSCTHSRRVIFSKNGNQTNMWHEGKLDINGSQVPKDYYILIEAEVGSSYHSDIAIDDLLIKSGTCTGN